MTGRVGRTVVLLAGIWLMATSHVVGGDVESARMTQNINSLKQLAILSHMYMGDHDGELPAAAEYLGDDKTPIFWLDPATGKRDKRFLYFSAGNIKTLKNPASLIIAASPKAFKGKRSVAYLDGSVKAIAEMDFIKRAKAQKWKLKIIPDEFKGSDELKANVEALIPSLGAKSFKDRKGAKKALRELGLDILPLLQQHVKTTDPEIKANLKEVIDRILEKQ